MKDVPYRETVGSLIYIATMTRPDIASAVSEVAQFNGDPRPPHWRAVKRVIRYLQGTKNYGLEYVQGKGFQLEAFADADWAGNLTTCKSRSGMSVLVDDVAVDWASRVQRSVAMSTFEAEYIAVSETLKAVLWFRKLARDYGMEDEAVPIICDNQGTVDSINGERSATQRSKHIAVRYMAVRDYRKRGLVSVIWRSTDLQKADIMTKALARVKFEKNRAQLGVKRIEYDE